MRKLQHGIRHKKTNSGDEGVDTRNDFQELCEQSDVREILKVANPTHPPLPPCGLGGEARQCLTSGMGSPVALTGRAAGRRRGEDDRRV